MNNIYEEKTVNKLLLTFSIPAILSLITEILTSVVDTVFAGHIGGVSCGALTAMGILSPLLAIFTALQTLFAISTAIMVAKYINDRDRINKSFIVGVVMSLVVAISTSIIIYIFMDKILILLGARGNVLTLSKDFLKIQLISNIFSSLGYTVAGVIRALGYPKVEFIVITSAVVVNIISNALLTFGFNLGIKGIALGTLISEVLCAFAAIIWLSKKKLWIKKIKIDVKEFINIAMKMFKIGISQTIIQILAGCTGFVVNGSLLAFSTLEYIAVWNVVQKVYMLMLMPIVGISQGAQTILAYFGSRKDNEKIDKTTKLSITYCGYYGFLVMLLMFFCGEIIVTLFGLDPTVKAKAYDVVKIVFLTFPLTGILYTNMTLLQVTDREVTSVVLALTRQVFTIVPLAIILPMIFSEANTLITPVIAIFLSIPISDVVSILVALLLIN